MILFGVMECLVFGIVCGSSICIWLRYYRGDWRIAAEIFKQVRDYIHKNMNKTVTFM